MSVLIFGASGQDGYYLTTLCQERGMEVLGVSRSSPPDMIDVSDYDQVARLIQNKQPTLLFHLAARSTTRHEALFENHRAIATGTLNVLEAVLQHSPKTRVFITGSGLQFANNGDPIRETDPFEARSPYAIARIQSTYAARYYRLRGLRVYVGYLFHHESPRRTSGHVSMQIVQAARRISTGSNETLRLGDLEVAKEWTYAGDVAAAMLTLVNQDEINEAIIGSGQAHSIREWVEVCFASLGLDWKQHVQAIPDFEPEYRRLVSDPSRIKSLGWSPQVELKELCRIMMENTR